MLSPDSLYACLWPYHHMRVLLKRAFKKDGSMALPDFLDRLKSEQTFREQRRAFHLNQILDYFPDRLAGPKWKGRCRIEGLGHLQAAQQKQRPVILAFFHFGPYILLRAWLRAAGFPAIVWLNGKSTRRLHIRRLMDRYSPWPEIPPVLYEDGWSEAIKHLRAGHPLLMALDVQRGKQIELPLCEGWTFQMASGAVRLAINNDAELIPCNLTDEGGWRYRLRLGKPVPPEYLASEKDWFRAGKHLLDEMLPDFHAHPEQCLPSFVRSLKPNAAVPTTTTCIPVS